MEITGKENPRVRTGQEVQQVTSVSQWDAGTEFLIEKEQEMPSVQLVNNTAASTEKNKLEQINKVLPSQAAGDSQASRGEKKKSSCCSQVVISSSGPTQEWYPDILGLYSLQPGSGPPVYKREDRERFLYRPRRGKQRQ